MRKLAACAHHRAVGKNVSIQAQRTDDLSVVLLGQSRLRRSGTQRCAKCVMPTRQLAKISLPFLIDGSEKHCASIKHVRIQSRHAHKAGMRTYRCRQLAQVAGGRSQVSSLVTSAVASTYPRPAHALAQAPLAALLISNNTALQQQHCSHDRSLAGSRDVYTYNMQTHMPALARRVSRPRGTGSVGAGHRVSRR